MADKAETPKILEELAKNNIVKPSQRLSRKKRSGRSRVGIILVLFAPLLLGIAYLAYQQMQLDLQVSQLSDQNSELSTSLAARSDQAAQVQALAQQIQQLQELQQTSQAAEVVEVDNSFAEALELRLNAEIEQLKSVIALLQSRPNATAVVDDSVLQLAQIEYLLSAANQRLQLQGDIATAIDILTSIDAKLSLANDPRLFALRETLSRDLISLAALQPLDVNGVYLRLSNVSTAVDDFVLATSFRENFLNRNPGANVGVAANVPPNGVAVLADSERQNYFDASLTFLQSVFVWRRWDESPDAILPEQQDIYVKQSLRLMLEQAQLALISKNDSLYKQSLSKCETWIRRYLLSDSPGDQSLLTEVRALLAIDVDPMLPNLADALQIIGELRAQ